VDDARTHQNLLCQGQYNRFNDVSAELFLIHWNKSWDLFPAKRRPSASSPQRAQAVGSPPRP